MTTRMRLSDRAIEVDRLRCARMPRPKSHRRDKFDVVFYSPWMSHLLAPAAGPAAGGAETQLRAVATALAARNLRVALIVDEVPSLPSQVGGVTIVAQRRPDRRLPEPLRVTLRVGYAWRALSRARGEVYVQRAAATITALVAVHARLRGRRFVFSTANVTDFAWERLQPHASARLLYALGLRLADQIVVQTNEQAGLCRRALGRDGVVVPSIAEAVPEGPVAPEAFVWVGRVEEPKNPAAFVRLARAVPEAHFRMVAVTPTPTAAALLERLRPEIEAVPNLELLAGRPRTELDSIYRSALAVTSTSVDYEGMPNVFLEGWARGVPALVLAHDPDGVVARYDLGWVAAGDEARLASLARTAWRERGDVAGLRSRCRHYVAAHHAPETIVSAWKTVLLERPQRPVRVLQILTQDAVGGTELMVLDLAQRLDSVRVEAEVALLAPGGPITAALIEQGVRAHALGSGLRAVWRLAALLRRTHYDVVHAYGFKGPMLARVLVRVLTPGTHLVVGVQSVVPAEAEADSTKGRLTLWVDRLTARLVDTYEANSRGALAHLARVGVPREKLRYIPNAIDLDTWSVNQCETSAPGRLVVSCVGRFIPRKRQADLVQAVALLGDRRAQCHLVFAGEGPSLEQVRSVATELGLRDSVEFRGHLDGEGVHELLECSSVYVQPSLYEGMPATVLEAMASGLPVVGTRVNGIEDLVVDGQTGLLVSPCSPVDLAVALCRLLDNPEERLRMGQAARCRAADCFDLQPVVEAKTALFLELASRDEAR